MWVQLATGRTSSSEPGLPGTKNRRSDNFQNSSLRGSPRRRGRVQTENDHRRAVSPAIQCGKGDHRVEQMGDVRGGEVEALGAGGRRDMGSVAANPAHNRNHAVDAAELHQSALKPSLPIRADMGEGRHEVGSPGPPTRRSSGTRSRAPSLSISRGLFFCYAAISNGQSGPGDILEQIDRRKALQMMRWAFFQEIWLVGIAAEAITTSRARHRDIAARASDR